MDRRHIGLSQILDTSGRGNGVDSKDVVRTTQCRDKKTRWRMTACELDRFMVFLLPFHGDDFI